MSKQGGESVLGSVTAAVVGSSHHVTLTKPDFNEATNPNEPEAHANLMAQSADQELSPSHLRQKFRNIEEMFEDVRKKAESDSSSEEGD